MKTVLITGASGFLGSWFADWFIRSEDPVNLWLVDLVPHPTGIPVDEEDIVTWLDDFDREVDELYHFAAPVGGREKIEGDPLYNADSLRIDSVVFRWAARHAKTMIYPSSSAVYGASLQEGEGIALYEDLFNPALSSWPAPDEMYGFTKMAGEMLAYKAAKYGLNTLCIRPFSGYGEGQKFEYPVPSIVRRALHQENPIQVWGSGEQRRDFVHVSDIVGATMARLEEPVVGYQTMNIGRGIPVSFNEIAQIAAAVAGYDAVIENILDKPVGVSSRYADITFQNEYYTPRVSLAEGLHRVLNWVRSLETPVKIGG